MTRLSCGLLCVCYVWIEGEKWTVSHDDGVDWLENWLVVKFFLHNVNANAFSSSVLSVYPAKMCVWKER